MSTTGADEGAAKLAGVLRENTTLKKLVLPYNQITDQGAAQLLEELNRRRRERVRKSGGNKEAKATNDRELDADLTEKQMFCTADGCRREP